MFYGYRMPSSTKNELTWSEANKYSANLMIYIGLINIAFPLYLGYMFRDHPSNAVLVAGVIIFAGSLATMIILTESHMKKMFDSDGNPRQGN